MEKLQQKIQYALATRKKAQTTAIAAAVVGVVATVLTFVCHVRFAVWDKVVACVVAVVASVVVLSAVLVGKYYGNYSAYLQAVANDLRQIVASFVCYDGVAVKYGMKFDVARFVDNGEPRTYYVLHDDDFAFESNCLYELTVSRTFVVEVKEAEDE